MIANYLKIAWRNMKRNKTTTFINLTGLSIALTCVILIIVYIQDEIKFDKTLPDSERIYQVNIDANFGGQAFAGAFTPPTVGPALHSEFPEIETYTRLYRMGNEVVSRAGAANNTFFKEEGILAVDSNFLGVFKYPLEAGNAVSCLQKPGSVVISRSIANKYFGKNAAIGQMLSFDEYSQPFIVTGILKDIPAQSSLQFDMLIPVSSCPPVKRFSWSWVWCQMTTYVVLRPNTPSSSKDIDKLEAQFPAMVKRLAVSAFKRIGQPFDEFLRKGGKWDFHLQPFQRIHLYSAGLATPYTNIGNITHVYTFGIVGLFIIILACVNFMNLSTARAAKRAREVGVRKVLGSQKRGLIFQFLSEALLLSSIAVIIALALALLSLPGLNLITQKSLSVSTIFSPFILGALAILLVATGLLAGSYPAFYLTTFNPVVVLKGNGTLPLQRGNSFLRNGLVAFQFAISVVLIICTIVVYRQMEYTRQKDLGMNQENVLIIPNVEKMAGSTEVFRLQLSGINGVKQVSITSGIPSGDSFTDFYVPETSEKEILPKDISLSSYLTDEYFTNALQLKIIKGRNFSKNYNDSASVIVNETAAREAGWKNPIGQMIRYPGGHDEKYKVIGVVKDFNTESLHATVTPFALFHESSHSYYKGTNYAVIRFSGSQPHETIKHAQEVWTQFVKDTPFEYSFLDKKLEALYHSDLRMGKLFSVFTLLALFIACLGLFGLSVYIAETRTKEIGIRKILGASEQGLAVLLSKDFLKPVLISFILAFPVAWWAMNKWLLDFAYRISLNWMIFALAGVTAISIALLTVSFQAIRTSLLSPIKSLKTE